MLFGKKKEVKQENFEESEEIKLPTLEEIRSEKIEREEPGVREEETAEIKEMPPQPLPEKREVVSKTEIRKGLPLFVKLEKYEEILRSIDELKEVLSLIKGSFSLFEESEKIKIETIKTIEKNIDKIEEKISSIDSTLARPSYEKEEKPKLVEAKDSLSELKLQIEKLKREMQSVG
jgi:valyl-tRNA synthetase